MTGYQIWLLSALAVLAVTTLGYTLASVAALVNGRDDAGPPILPGNDRDPDRPRRIERFVYRHHRAFGAVILLGALIYLSRMTASGLIWSDAGHAPWLVWLPAMTALHLLLLPFGAVMFLRPSLLKRIEAIGNRWVDWQRGRAVHLVRALLGLYCLAALLALALEHSV